MLFSIKKLASVHSLSILVAGQCPLLVHSCCWPVSSPCPFLLLASVHSLSILVAGQCPVLVHSCCWPVSTPCPFLLLASVHSLSILVAGQCPVLVHSCCWPVSTPCPFLLLASVQSLSIIGAAFAILSNPAHKHKPFTSTYYFYRSQFKGTVFDITFCMKYITDGSTACRL